MKTRNGSTPYRRWRITANYSIYPRLFVYIRENPDISANPQKAALFKKAAFHVKIAVGALYALPAFHPKFVLPQYQMVRVD